MSEMNRRISSAHLQWFCDKPQDYVQNMKGDDKVLAFLKDELYLSKKEGAEWTIEAEINMLTLPEQIKEG